MIWSYRIFSADVDCVCVPIVYSVFFKGIFLHISLQFLRNLFFPIFVQLRLLYSVRFFAHLPKLRQFAPIPVDFSQGNVVYLNKKNTNKQEMFLEKSLRFYLRSSYHLLN